MTEGMVTQGPGMFGLYVGQRRGTIKRGELIAIASGTFVSKSHLSDDDATKGYLSLDGSMPKDIADK
jgi:hypothetical protein